LLFLPQGSQRITQRTQGFAFATFAKTLRPLRLKRGYNKYANVNAKCYKTQMLIFAYFPKNIARRDAFLL